MLKFKKSVYEEIRRVSEAAYPHECCGALIGKFSEDGSATAVSSVSLTNMNTTRANDRYEVNPAELLKVEKDVKREGLDVIGFFHSHPDHPSKPSQFDRDRGWPEYHYTIVSVESGAVADIKNWKIEAEDKPFGSEPFEVEVDD
ncbi:MAG: M67 family metallopeptidase [Deltaproteobacteria bacterium]|nr:M67 family metallopeptidase [Deltaproteobacteria bacterium]